MKLEDFLRLSALPLIQVKSMYFKPNIPQDKLANAIREYAHGVGMSTVAVLIDETFWGNAKEGLLITNENIRLSKKLGGSVIALASVSEIRIHDHQLIVNDSPVAKLSNPEVMPCAALGATLNDFVLASRKAAISLPCPAAVDYSTMQKLAAFLARLTVPRYFDSAPAGQRKPGATTTSYALTSALTEEQRQLLRFKGSFAPNEELLCAAWLDSHVRDEFFCVTNCGVHSIRSSRPVVFISHDDLRNLSAIEEYQESRYVGLRLSNGDGVIVSVQNAFVRPYAFELFSGVINILNGHEPPGPGAEDVSSQRPVNAAPPVVANLARTEDRNAIDQILVAAIAAMENDHVDDDEDEDDRQFLELFFGPFRKVYGFATSVETRRKLWPAGSPPTEDMLFVYVILVSCLYSNGLQSLPQGFKSEMGDAWFSMHALSQVFREAIQATCERAGVAFELDEESAMVIQLLTCDLGRGTNRENDEFLSKVLSHSGVDKPSELAVMAFEKVGIPAQVTRQLLKQATVVTQEWYLHLAREAAAGRLD